MNILTKIWSGIEKNRWTTLIPVPIGLSVVGVQDILTTTHKIRPTNGIIVVQRFFSITLQIFVSVFILSPFTLQKNRQLI